MPFDVSKSCGKWKHGTQSDNFPQMMEAMGVPAAVVAAMKERVTTVESTLSGDQLTFKVEAMGKTVVNTHTLGVEGEEQSSIGKRKVTYTMEGDCMVSVYPVDEGRGTVRTSRQFLDDDTIRTDIEFGDLKGWSTSKRC